MLKARSGTSPSCPPVLGAACKRLARHPAGALIGPGAGDNAGAALGVAAGVGDVVVSIGTSGTVFAVAEQAHVGSLGLVAGFADATGHYLPLVCTLNASRVLDATAALLSVSLPRLSELALSARPGAGGLAFVPYFEVSGPPTSRTPQARCTA